LIVVTMIEVLNYLADVAAGEVVVDQAACMTHRSGCLEAVA
jgi:hypothetical protein